MTLSGTPHVVVGVMPRGFDFPRRDIALWLPLWFEPQDLEDRSNVYLQGIGRLAPGVTIGQARAELNVIAEGLARAFPEANERTGATVIELRDEVSRQSRLMLLALAGASVCVLLIACANLASLLLARAVQRQRELAVRVAMGARPRRIARQVLTESLVLSAGGGAIGMLLAWAAVPRRRGAGADVVADRRGPDRRPAHAGGRRSGDAGHRARLRLGAGVAHRARDRAAPTWPTGTRVFGSRAPSTCDRRSSSPKWRRRWCCSSRSGLFLRAMWRVQNVDPGFRAEGVLTARTALPSPKYDPVTAARAVLRQGAAGRARRARRAERRLHQLPADGDARRHLEGDHARDIGPCRRPVGERALRHPRILHDDGDPGAAGPRRRDPRRRRPRSSSPSSADRWPSASGRARIRSAATSRWRSTNASSSAWSATCACAASSATASRRSTCRRPQVKDGWLTFYAPKDLVVRTSGAVAPVVAAIRDAVSRADPEQPVSDVRTLVDIVEGETAGRSVQVSALGAFAAIAVLLACLGIHGLLSFVVASRTQEIGVRMAFGATAGHGARPGARPHGRAGGDWRRGRARRRLRGEPVDPGAARRGEPGRRRHVRGRGRHRLRHGAGRQLVPARRAVGVDPLAAIRVE